MISVELTAVQGVLRVAVVRPTIMVPPESKLEPVTVSVTPPSSGLRFGVTLEYTGSATTWKVEVCAVPCSVAQFALELASIETQMASAARRLRKVCYIE